MSQTICYVLSAFPVLSETFVTNEIRAMRARGHTIVPVALAPFDGPCQPEDEVFRGTTVQLADIPALRALAIRPDRLLSAMRFVRAQTGIPARSLLFAAARVALVIKQRGCTHVHAHFAHSATATAIVAARLAGVSVSFIAHGYDVYGDPCDLPAKLAAADVVFATCNDMAMHFRDLAPTVNVHVTPCGIDPDRFVPVELPCNGRFLAIGRLAEQKGYPVLLQALALLPAGSRPVIDVVGSGPLEAEIKAEAKRLGVASSVNLLGPKPSDWIAAEGPAYLGLVAPFVICKNGDRDTGPVVVKEAMAMGLPVIASALMGLKEMVTAQTGRLVQPCDPLPLAAALAWMTALPDADRRALGRVGRERVLALFTLAMQAKGMSEAIALVQGARACAA